MKIDQNTAKILIQSQKKLSKATVKKAIKEMRLYLGGLDKLRIRDQQRLYDRVGKSIDKIADQTGMNPHDVREQLADKARSLGIITPMPGKDY